MLFAIAYDGRVKAVEFNATKFFEEMGLLDVEFPDIVSLLRLPKNTRLLPKAAKRRKGTVRETDC